MNNQEKKNYAEKIHIEYLLGELNLRVFDPVGGFDLISDRHLLELKSKLCIFNRSGPSPNIWWALSDPQIKDYEARYAVKGMGYLWIFLHALTEKPSPKLKSKKALRENVYHRDVFIAPWEIYKHSQVGITGHGTKTGPYRHVSRKNLIERINFAEFPLEKGTLHLPQDRGLEYLIKSR